MSGNMLALQGAVFTALDAALACSVYDTVPPNSAFPYVSFGEDTVVDWSAALIDGEDFTLTLHAWDRARGRKSVREILATIKDTLHEQPLTVSGRTLVELRFDFSTVLDDPDGQTIHGVIRFRGLITRNS